MSLQSTHLNCWSCIAPHEHTRPARVCILQGSSRPLGRIAQGRELAHRGAGMGGAHVREWTVDDLRALSRDLDEKVARGAIKWKSAVNVWGTASKMCADATRSKLDEQRCRADNPAASVEGPARGTRTAKQYLYPSSEFLQFITAERVPPEVAEERRAARVSVPSPWRASRAVLGGRHRPRPWDGAFPPGDAPRDRQREGNEDGVR
jgi:hypothetical protein